jgi:hypothetical protein
MGLGVYPEGMATILERTVTDDVADALRALSDAERYLNDARAHLVRAITVDEGDCAAVVAQARRVVRIAAGCVDGARRHIAEAERRA